MTLKGQPILENVRQSLACLSYEDLAFSFCKAVVIWSCPGYEVTASKVLRDQHRVKR